ncbi:MAG: hypothetical protein WC373_13655 [Smithella sp.]|jgi:hypothetical protein
MRKLAVVIEANITSDEDVSDIGLTLSAAYEYFCVNWENSAAFPKIVTDPHFPFCGSVRVEE